MLFVLRLDLCRTFKDFIAIVLTVLCLSCLPVVQASQDQWEQHSLSVLNGVAPPCSGCHEFEQSTNSTIDNLTVPSDSTSKTINLNLPTGATLAGWRYRAVGSAESTWRTVKSASITGLQPGTNSFEFCEAYATTYKDGDPDPAKLNCGNFKIDRNRIPEISLQNDTSVYLFKSLAHTTIKSLR